MPIHKIAQAALWLAVIAVWLTGCLPSAPQPASSPIPAALTSTNTPTPPPTDTPTTAPTPAPISIWLPAYLPDKLVSGLQLPEDWVIQTDVSQSVLALSAAPDLPLSSWIYALAAPFPTLTDEIGGKDMQDLWRSGRKVPGGPASLLVDQSTLEVMTLAWGTPSRQVQVIPSARLLDETWQTTAAWAILPFEDLEPRWKVITLDGQNPLEKAFDPQAYPLRISFGLSGDAAMLAHVSAQHGPQSAAPLLPATNRRPDHLTTVMLTGVTALVRGTAAYMENFGMDYPASEIGPWLRDADILHISNEIAFAKNCPSPSNWDGLKFCSQARYIQLLEDIGTDVVDLAGDHFADWGPEAMLFSLDLYAQHNWPVYGGGANIEAARQPALFEHNGNKIAFLGCNAKEIGYSTAGPSSPGAVHCDDKWLLPAIRAVKAKGYLPIVTFQHQEYYEYIARPQLQVDFRAAAAAGAVIVSGSQAHQPHTFEFTHSGAFLHYGLGNLFFDQVFSMDATDKAFIDRHVFYEGRYIGTQLLTIQFVDYARARPMTPAERESLLRAVFAAGGYAPDSPLK